MHSHLRWKLDKGRLAACEAVKSGTVRAAPRVRRRKQWSRMSPEAVVMTASPSTPQARRSATRFPLQSPATLRLPTRAAAAGARAGALAEGLPETDLIVSPQHRILVSSVIAQRMVGKRELMVAAKHLVGLAGIAIAEDMQEVTYYHFLLDAHRVVWSNGARSESLYTGLTALNTLSAGARQEIFELFPELEDAAAQVDEAIFTPAAYLMPGRPARSLRARHLKNEKQLLMDSPVAHHV